MQNKVIKKIESYLSGLPGIEKEHESKQSVYYSINNKKIRVSDHLPKRSQADLNIIVPFNFAESFIVFATRTPLVLPSWQELNKFINHYVFVEYAKTLSKK